MYKRKFDNEKRDKEFKKRVTRNWIICGVTLVLIIICYYFV